MARNSSEKTACLICPHCTNANVDKMYVQQSVPAHEAFLLEDKTLQVDGESLEYDWNGAGEAALFCRACFQAFPIPVEFDMEWE